jgi:hypothetical protein
MAWNRRWRIDSKEKWRRIVTGLLEMTFDPEKRPVVLVLREELVEKTPAQRALFHAICGDLAPHLGLTPRACKLLVKARFYGVEAADHDGVIVAIVPSSEDSDREEYSQLIDFAYQMAAEQGIHLADRRTK